MIIFYLIGFNLNINWYWYSILSLNFLLLSHIFIMFCCKALILIWKLIIDPSRLVLRRRRRHFLFGKWYTSKHVICWQKHICDNFWINGNVRYFITDMEMTWGVSNWKFLYLKSYNLQSSSVNLWSQWGISINILLIFVLCVNILFIFFCWKYESLNVFSATFEGLRWKTTLFKWF